MYGVLQWSWWRPVLCAVGERELLQSSRSAGIAYVWQKALVSGCDAR
jgi:hypothetical protein